MRPDGASLQFVRKWFDDGFQAAFGFPNRYCCGFGYTREEAKRRACEAWEIEWSAPSRPGSEDKGYVSNYRNHSAYR